MHLTKSPKINPFGTPYLILDTEDLTSPKTNRQPHLTGRAAQDPSYADLNHNNLAFLLKHHEKGYRIIC